MPESFARHGISALVFALAAASPLAAQGSPYIPLDDPSLPLLEHLIARGDIDDPSPMVRPFRRIDALDALARADTQPGTRSGAIIAALHVHYAEPAVETWWRAGARAGAQAYTTPRRELLHPVGEGGAAPYGDISLQAGFGPFVAATRPAIESRVTDDPDWPGRRNVDIAGRLLEGYLSGQFKYFRFAYGQLDHNWGPTGLPGIPLSNYGYERQGLLVELGNRKVRLTALATDLRDGPDTAGQLNHRYYFVHRLAVRFSDRVEVAAWEGNVLAGADRNFETRYRNPLSFGYLANTVGLGDRGNEILGLDATWRAAQGMALEAQVAIDDFWYQDRDQNRDRWALTVGARGRAPAGASWRLLYTQVSSLALRAFNNAENFTDAGVGLGRTFSDNDQLTLRLAVPVRTSWIFSPELTLFRQGEGRIEDPYPVQPELASTPALFIGTVERTLRAGVAVSGREGPLEVTGDAGIHHVSNAGHVEGASETRFEARVQVTVGIGGWGEIGE
ncbi:MAG TPA: hypothetical protein VFT04_10450 [Gemmatimonadales bacterium]|nr:hypothetical protein [Gemmatimonadales bacterium]